MLLEGFGMSSETENQVRIAYAMWRKRTILERRNDANWTASLSLASIVVFYLFENYRVQSLWYFLLFLLLSLIMLFAMVKSLNADRVPSWDDLIRSYEYEAWQIAERARNQKL